MQLSPGVEIKERDLSTTVAPVASGVGATVGFFEWGPVGEVVTVTSENDLVAKFGAPTNGTADSFFGAANFLRYADNLKVVRVAGTASYNATDGGGAVSVKNRDDFDSQYTALVAGTEAFVARYAGAEGNKLVVSYSDFTNWGTFVDANLFDTAPDSAKDEVGITVRYYDESVAAAPDYVDTTVYTAGQLTMDGGVAFKCIKYLDQDATADGVVTPNVSANSDLFWEVVGFNVVESFIVSATDGFTGPTGENNYANEVINNRSKWIYVVSENLGAAAQEKFSNGGVAAPVNGDWTDGWDLMANPEEVDVQLLVAGGANGLPTADSKLVSEYIVNQVAFARGDCMAFISPAKQLVTDSLGDPSTITTALVDYRDSLNVGAKAGTYCAMDGNVKYQYDKYNDKYRWMNLSADIAGLCVFTDNVRDPWWSPGGLNRGAIKSVVKLGFNPAQAYRDTLYKNAINPVVSFPGQGTVLWGDKTMTNKPSAFDRINVRRLFIFIEKAISRASKYFLFEFNDSFTRSQFVSTVDPFLRDVKGRRGMSDYLVVCDGSNNTSTVIDANEFRADFYIKPTKSINFITLTFVATKTGVAFSEVIG